ncbi:hypothetical protein GCM10022419_062340 [Nonomuraea rosea]|uniref:Uncharacterized protein n=1 Tax=Nonomuraea rosea TaxID=638574 RepID=A0ABP6XXG1_9ACTN
MPQLLGDDRRDVSPSDPRSRPVLAAGMTRFDARDPDPGAGLLDKIDAREQALTCQTEQIQAEIDALTAMNGRGIHEIRTDMIIYGRAYRRYTTAPYDPVTDAVKATERASCD